MKKFLSFLMMAMLFTTAFATEATMAAGTNGSTASVNGQDAIKCGTSSKSGDMTITVGAGATELTFYAAAWNGVTNSTLEITPEAKVSVSKVALTANTGIAGNSPFTLAEGTDEEDYKFTITLSNVTEETTFTLTGSKRFVVWGATYSTGSTPVVTVATPVISGTTPFDDETEVSISCETTGASIYYTLDGSTPDNQSTQYTGAFDINATTTVKAIAYKDNTASSVASKVFTMNPKRVNIGTVDALNKLADDTEFTYISDVVVTGQTGQYLYVQDETAATLLFGQAGQTYKFGDVIPAGWTGKKVTYHGAPEMTNLAGLQASFFTNEVPVKEFDTKTAASLENFSQYGVIKNVTIDLEGKKLVAEDYTEIAYYDRFKVAFPEVVEGKKFNVNIIVGYYDAPQVYPVAFEEVVEPEAPKYSLVGYINGADYACEGDYENPGQYLFDEDGKLTVNFEQTSYVFVKLTDNSKWFLTEAYVPQAEAFIGETATTTATMVNGANFGEKMQVPAGEVEISLTVTDENTVVLTYSLPGTKEPEQETEYYVAGNFNNWAADGAKMTKNENGIWEYAFQVEAGSYEFKVTDGTWNHSWPASNYAFSANATSDVLITFNEETQEVNAVVTPIVPDPEINFTVEGEYDEAQDAYVNSAIVKVAVENMPEGGKVQYRVDLRDELMVAPAEEEEITWTDYTEDGVLLTQSAIVSVRVLDATGEELASNEVEVAVVSKSTGINDINVNSAKVVKMIENGEVIIVKNGAKYNMMGQKK